MTILTKKTAKFSRNKITTTAIALFLITIMAGSLMFIPTAKAATVIAYYHSYIYVSVGSNPIGIGQQMLLVCWTVAIPPDVGETAGLLTVSPYNGAVINRAGWDGESFNVTAPDGTTTNYPLGRSDPVGSGYLSFTPTEVGTYTVISIFPAVWKNSTDPTVSSEAGYPNLEDQYYSAAVSLPVTFTVQQEPIAAWPETPLPTGYWSLPINGANRDWYMLAGNWLAGAAQQWPLGAAGGVTLRFNYGLGPESAHILWAKPFYAGGIMDTRFGDISYETSHYTGLDFSPPIILDGILYYSAQVTGQYRQGWNAVDLYTGKTLYYSNSTTPSFGQIYNYESPNQHGGFPYLWRTVTGLGSGNGTVWEMLDGYTGISTCMIANVSATGTQVYGLDGSITYYNLVNYGTTTAPNYHLTVWNSSAIPAELAGTSGTTYWQWRPAAHAIYDGATGFSLNVSIPNIMGPQNAIVNQTGTIRCVREGQYIIIGTAGSNDERGVVPGFMRALSLAPGKQGTKLWETPFTPPFASQLGNVTISMTGVYPEDDVILFESTQLLKRWGYSMTTGQEIWESAPEPQFNYYGESEMNGMDDFFYQGLLLSFGYSGVILAYNVTTGEIVWNYTATNVGFESPYGNYPISISCIADGMLYTTACEHSPGQPLWRGPNLRCINATNGQLIWDILFWGQQQTGSGMAYIADGLLLDLNLLDARIYCFGKGNSGTTVSAPQTVPTLGSSVMLTGTVTDQTSTGSLNINDAVDFTLKGTPAISDASMSAWMEYMYEQQPFPTNATGVPVSLDAIDPNGNYIHIGNVTSDIHGNYGCEFTPQVPGQYQILATFAGSNSYGPSSGSTYMAVGQAPVTPAPTSTPLTLDAVNNSFMTYIAVGVIAIIIAIAIVGVLLLRKRP